MASVVQRLKEAGLITPPPWMSENMVYETMAGSVTYGVSTDDSDVDVYGACIPPKAVVFPHLAGEIVGFGRQKQRFEQWQQHHVEQPSHVGKPKVYDFTIFNIVRYFSLAMECNPNVIDTLFTSQACVLSVTAVGNMIRDGRRLFLHKGAWFKFKGYAYSQLHKMGGHERSGRRKELHEQFGFDVKFAYHVVRLLYEAEMILGEGDLDLQRHSEHLKAIRRGEVPEADIRAWAADKEKHLEKLYETSSLRHSPDEPAIKRLLLQCLEHHYGSLADAVVDQDAAKTAIAEIVAVVDKYRRLAER